MDKGKRGRGGGVTRGGLFRRIASARPPRPPPTMPDREPSAGQPPTIGGRPPPPAPRAREPAAGQRPAVFRQVAQGRHGPLLHLQPEKAVTVATIIYYGNSWWYLQQVFALSETRPAEPGPLQWHRLTSWPADHGPGWVGGGLQTGPPDRRRISPQLFPLPPRSHSRRPFLPPLRGGSLENRGQKTEKSKRGPKKFL